MNAGASVDAFSDDAALPLPEHDTLMSKENIQIIRLITFIIKLFARKVKNYVVRAFFVIEAAQW